MVAIPYVERRRQKFYLRCRYPADLVLLTGRKFFTKSLQTADPRRARAEAARLLAGLHTGWQEARRDVIRIAGKRLNEIDVDDVPTIRADDLSALSPEDRAAVIARLETLVERGELEAEQAEVAAARLQAEADQRHAVTSAAEHQQARRETLALGKLLARVLSQSAAATAPAPAAKLPPEARQPWRTYEDKFFTDRPSVGASAKKSHQQAFADLESVIGKKPLAEVTKADIKQFADYLRDKPINRAGRQRLSRETIVKLLQHVRAYFAWTVESGFITTNPADGVKPRTETRDERHGRNERRAFTTDELNRLFDSPLFTGCKSRSRRSTPGKEVYKDERYWFFLLALLTGARVEEIAAVPSALVNLEGTLCLDFRHASKTGAGPRLIPMHPELRKLGLTEWAATQARRDRGLVEGPNASADWSKWGNRYLDAIGLDDPALVVYSLRHNFRQTLRAADLHPEIVDKIFGHEGDSVGAGYGRDLSPAEARLVVERVRSPIPLEHLYPLLRISGTKGDV